MIEQINIKTPTQFVGEIEKIVQEKKITYLDAVMYFVDTRKVEVETVASLIKGSQVLKAKIQGEAEDLRLVKSGAKLPL
jgi:hypothetical protein